MIGSPGGGGKVGALRAIRFFPCAIPSDFLAPNPQNCFAPLYAHFLFPDEVIQGWTTIAIDIFFTVDELDIFISISGTPVGSANWQEHVHSSPSASGTSTSLPAVVCPQHTAAVDKVIAAFDTIPFPRGRTNSADEFLKKLSKPRRQLFRLPGSNFGEVWLPELSYSFSSRGNHSSSCPSTSKKLPSALPVLTVAGDTGNHKNAAGEEPQLVVRALSFFSEEGESNYLHRRAEWMMHFFIDACSAIDYDPRWKVLMAYAKVAIDSPAGGRRRRGASCSSDAKRNLKRQRTTSSLSEEATEFTDRQEPPTATDPGKANEPPPRRSQRFAVSAAADGPVENVGSEMEGMSDDTASEIDYRYELVGLVSLYKFFALPKCRRRVSQFLVLPTYQGCGVGLALLECVQRVCMQENDVRQFAVEDPAHAFRQLRDIVSLKVAVEAGILPRRLLFPSSTPSGEEVEKFEKLLDLIGSRLREDAKESSMQVARLKDVLNFARILPHPPPPPPDLLFHANADVVPSARQPKPASSPRGLRPDLREASPFGSAASSLSSSSFAPQVARDWRPIATPTSNSDKGGSNHSANTTDGKLQIRQSPAEAQEAMNFMSSDALAQFRLKMKKKKRMRNLDWLASMRPAQVRQELEASWKRTYACMYRTVVKVRGMFPLDESQ